MHRLQSFEQFCGADYYPEKDLLVWVSDKKGIQLKNLAAGEQRQVTARGRAEGSPAFSPDGNRLLFLSDKGSGRQIFVLDLNNGTTRQITHLFSGVAEPLWSPDGSRILFSAPEEAQTPQQDGDREREEEDGEVLVIEDFGYKFDGRGFIRPRGHMHLWCVNTEDGRVERITSGPFDYRHAVWSPDGTQIACVSGRYRSRENGLALDLLLIEAKANGGMKRLTEDQWAVSYPNPIRPVFTPDGSAVIAGFLQPVKEGDQTYPDVYLYEAALDGSGKKQLFFPDEKCFQCVQFPYNASCGRGMEKLQITEKGDVLFVAGWNGQCRLYRLKRDGNGKAFPLIFGKCSVNGISSVRDKKVLVAMSEPAVPEYYCVYDLETETLSQPVCQSAAELCREGLLCRSEDFFFDTADGDSRVHGWVMLPPKCGEKQKCPVILYIHGGPHPFYTYGFTLEHQIYAAAGFAVICCNPRGSSSYGRNHQCYEKAYDGRACEDILQFAEEAVKRFPCLDGERIGVTGGSYGGYMTNYIATHSHRFRAYVSQRSIVNELLSYSSSDLQGSSRAYEDFTEFMANKLKNSAVAYAERVEAPMLILHGENDYRCPTDGAYQWYAAIRDTHPNLPAKLMIYPDTAHEQPEDPKLLGDYYTQILVWFEEYLR